MAQRTGFLRALLGLGLAIAPGPAAGAGTSSTAEDARATLRSEGCLACHTADGTPHLAPSLAGLFGTRRRVIRAGSPGVVEVVADRDYVARAVREPDAELADGFEPGLMPQLDLPPEDVERLVGAVAALAEPPAPARGSLASLGAAAFLFVALHLLLSSQPVRPRIVAALGGELRFQGLYSVLALGTFVWMILAWRTAPFVLLWSSPPWTRWVPLLVMPFASYLSWAAFTVKNPAAAGQESALGSEDPGRGVLRITRHPMLCSYAMWGLAHLAPNGDLASLFLFGSIAALSLLGMMHIERRRQRALGERWRSFTEATSVVPFAAVLSGRARLRRSDFGPSVVVFGLAQFVVLLLAHQWVVGASPYPF